MLKQSPLVSAFYDSARSAYLFSPGEISSGALMFYCKIVTSTEFTCTEGSPTHRDCSADEES